MLAAVLAMLASVWLGGTTATADTAGLKDPSDDAHAALLANFSTRLRALDARDADAYMRLGEDVAEEASEPRGYQLARTLFVHAIEIDRGRGGAKNVAASALLALSDLARGHQEATWLRSIAATLSVAGTTPVWVQREQIGLRDDVAYKAATVLGEIRSGDGAAARALLRDPAVRAVLDRYARLLSESGAAGGVLGLDRDAERWPCPQCQNQRVLRRAGNVYEACANCGGDPGPVVTDANLAAQLRLESWLLSGIQRSWGAQLLSDLGTPLREPDVSMVAASQGVDATKRRWMDGQWVP